MTTDSDRLAALRERITKAEAAGNHRLALRLKSAQALATPSGLAPNGVPIRTATERTN